MTKSKMPAVFQGIAEAKDQLLNEAHEKIDRLTKERDEARGAARLLYLDDHEFMDRYTWERFLVDHPWLEDQG